MWNKNVRNLAFRVETINKVFEEINHRNVELNKDIINIEKKVENIINFYKKKDNILKSLDNIKQEINIIGVSLDKGILFETGREAGLLFAKDVLVTHYSKLVKITEKEKVDIWCQYDSDVGWGKFKNMLNDDIESGKVLIEECFLTYRMSGRKCIKLCDWMKGYILGIFEAISPFKNYIVETDYNKCQNANMCCFIINQISN